MNGMANPKKLIGNPSLHYTVISIFTDHAVSHYGLVHNHKS
jgi:hypothetical protein